VVGCVVASGRHLIVGLSSGTRVNHVAWSEYAGPIGCLVLVPLVSACGVLVLVELVSG
jgi:hypothetical protein